MCSHQVNIDFSIHGTLALFVCCRYVQALCEAQQRNYVEIDRTVYGVFLRIRRILSQPIQTQHFFGTPAMVKRCTALAQQIYISSRTKTQYTQKHNIYEFHTLIFEKII